MSVVVSSSQAKMRNEPTQSYWCLHNTEMRFIVIKSRDRGGLLDSMIRIHREERVGFGAVRADELMQNSFENMGVLIFIEASLLSFSH